MVRTHQKVEAEASVLWGVLWGFCEGFVPDFVQTSISQLSYTRHEIQFSSPLVGCYYALGYVTEVYYDIVQLRRNSLINIYIYLLE